MVSVLRALGDAIEQLAPCPFCGNQHPDVVQFPDGGELNWRVVCLPCLHSNRESEAAAIRGWNRRTS